jgi:mono/diheme cytochrome c family protein
MGSFVMKPKILLYLFYGFTAGVLFFSGVASAETLLERGTYLMNSVVACGNCHTPGSLSGNPDSAKELAGGTKFDNKPFTAYAPNITPDKETGIGGWTDAQIIRAIREGKRPDGTTIGPPMPIGLYRGISDRDVRAIVAYLRSVKPMRNKVPKSVYRMPLPPAYGPPVKSVPEVSRSDKVRYGEYLAGPLGHCVECHTPFAGPGRRDFKNRLGAGGFPLKGTWGTTISANITPDKKTGIGGWTDRQIKTAVKVGYSAKYGKMFPPMGYHFYKNINGKDMNALIAYLRSLKPVVNKRPVRHTPPGKK